MINNNYIDWISRETLGSHTFVISTKTWPIFIGRHCHYHRRHYNFIVGFSDTQKAIPILSNKFTGSLVFDSKISDPDVEYETRRPCGEHNSIVKMSTINIQKRAWTRQPRFDAVHKMKHFTEFRVKCHSHLLVASCLACRFAAIHTFSFSQSKNGAVISVLVQTWLKFHFSHHWEGMGAPLTWAMGKNYHVAVNIPAEWKLYVLFDLGVRHFQLFEYIWNLLSRRISGDYQTVHRIDVDGLPNWRAWSKVIAPISALYLNWIWDSVRNYSWVRKVRKWNFRLSISPLF